MRVLCGESKEQKERAPIKASLNFIQVFSNRTNSIAVNAMCALETICNHLIEQHLKLMHSIHTHTTYKHSCIVTLDIFVILPRALNNEAKPNQQQQKNKHAERNITKDIRHKSLIR